MFSKSLLNLVPILEALKKTVREDLVFDIQPGRLFRPEVDIPEGIGRIFLGAISIPGDTRCVFPSDGTNPGCIDVTCHVTDRNGGVPIPLYPTS